MKLSELKNKNIAIWGFGVEGQATALYLVKKKLPFTVLCREDEINEKYPCLTDQVDVNVLNQFDVIIKSPGISPYTDLVRSCHAVITSPTALWFSNEKKTKVIAVTGTKGKSTTVSLLAHILKYVGKSINLVGNIGQALISSHSDYDYIVLEASSFQIYDGNIKADIALITNLFPEHVDWHKGEKNYFSDKLKILENANSKIINANNERLIEKVKGSDYLYFNIDTGFHVKHDTLYYRQNKLVNLSEIQLIGKHNLENIGAVLTVCQEIGLNISECVESIKSFKPLQHRLQNLGRIGRHYAINDSIATTPIATLAAMQTVDLSKTTLLIGGFDRGHDWTEFAESINESPPHLLLISGQNAQAIFRHLQNLNAQFNYKLCENLEKAIHFALLNSPIDHTILMSPGAPSFDQFKSYIERGEFFINTLRVQS